MSEPLALPGRHDRSDPLRVTLINLWPRGGMAHYTASLANALAAQEQIALTVVVPRRPAAQGFAPNVHRVEVDVPTGNGGADLRRLPAQLLRSPAYLRAIAQTRPHVVHANLSTHPWELASLPWLAARWPLVVTQHEVAIKEGEDGWRKRWCVWAGPRYAHHIIVHGETLAAELTDRRGIPRPRISVMPLGLFDTLTAWATGVPQEPATVLFFGRIKAYKGLEYLVQAIPQVAAAVPGVRFVIVGGEGNLAAYRALAGAAAAPVEWVNRFVDDAEAAAFFRRASVVALPYTGGSASAVIATAYAFGRPVVTTRVASLPEAVVEGHTGLLVPPRDAGALAEALTSLLQDPSRRRAMGQNARRWAEEHLAWEPIARWTVEVYERVRRAA